MPECYHSEGKILRVKGYSQEEQATVHVCLSGGRIGASL